ncbi:hypothetical protein CN645_02175 [Burkholderia sp. IDO3]|nr:hypothetical protein CN645_02175 [Burkholderia sp. IDO3]
MTDANAYAPSFIPMYNARFARPPRIGVNAHRPLRDDANLNQGDGPALARRRHGRREPATQLAP